MLTRQVSPSAGCGHDSHHAKHRRLTAFVLRRCRDTEAGYVDVGRFAAVVKFRMRCRCSHE
jgi:hypothetical protein